MKDNNSYIGGSLQPQYCEVYAQYFVKYIQEMKEKGITIDAIATQNEPLQPENNPSMLMTTIQQTVLPEMWAITLLPILQNLFQPVR